jgi:indole-3-glycerol phosphate synthase
VQGFSASTTWARPVGTLGDLTTAAHARAAAVMSSLASLIDAASDLPAPPSLAKALRAPRIQVIAEVKRASPSKGGIAPGLDAAAQAVSYVQGGAAAISVLTEPSRFDGSLDDLRWVAETVHVPIIRKDFLVEPVQLWEARVAGASAALLIVRALAPSELARMMDTIHECGLEAIVEVRDRWELDRALAVNAAVIGVNNRNLETLVIDRATAPSLIPSIPKDRIAVAESGMRTAADIAGAAAAGADAVLVGSAVSAAADPAAAVRALAGIRRIDR